MDDLLIAGNSNSLLKKVTDYINTRFELKELGHVCHYLSIDVKRREDGSFMISQPRYIDKIVEEAGLSACKPSKIPLDTGYYKQDQSQALESNEEYRKLIGMILYLATNTRPDIAASVSILSRKVASPSRADLSEMHRLVRYLRGTRDLKLRLVI